MIVAMAGLPGTGKSTLARALAGSGVVLDKDLIRSVLFPSGYVEYSTEQDDFCQGLMLETAGYLTTRHLEVRIFLDGRTFSRNYQLLNLIEFARRLKTQWRIIECVCEESSARHRLEASAGSHLAHNRTYALYQRLRAEFEPITLPKLVVNTDAPLEECVAAARAYLESA
jgi:adenylylsulfate kinase